MKKKTRIFSFFIFLIIFCFFFMANAHAGEWALSITATGQYIIKDIPGIGEIIPNNESPVEIGQDANATTLESIPPPPNYTVYMEIHDGLVLDYRPSDSIREAWNLIVRVEQDADSGYPDFLPELSWDTNDIDPNTLLELRLGGADGPVIVSDMSTESTYQTTQADAEATGYYTPTDPNNHIALMQYAVIYKDALSIVTQEIPLAQGWNLISFQVGKCYYQEAVPTVFIPEGAEKEEVDSLQAWLSDDLTSPLRDTSDPSKAGNWQRIISFDDNYTIVLENNVPDFFNTLKYLSVGYGYWIKMNAPATLILEGQPLPSDTPLVLRNGWNLVGCIPIDTCYADIDQGAVCPYYTGHYTTEDAIQYCSVGSVSSVFDSINGQYRRIISFDSCIFTTVFEANVPPYFNTLNYIGPKYGYWIKIEDPNVNPLIFPENCSGI